MNMKFLKGCFELDHEVTNLEEYEAPRKAHLLRICEWADTFDMAVQFGTNDNGDYLCEYCITGSTVTYCKGLKAELKDLLKKMWKKPTVVFEASGEKLR